MRKINMKTTLKEILTSAWERQWRESHRHGGGERGYEESVSGSDG